MCETKPMAVRVRSARNLKDSDVEEETAISVKGSLWLRIPIRTHVLTEKDDLTAAVLQYAVPRLCPGDILFLSEKAVAVNPR